MNPKSTSVSRMSTMAEIIAEVFPSLVNGSPGLSPAERAEILQQFRNQTGKPMTKSSSQQFREQRCSSRCTEQGGALQWR